MDLFIGSVLIVVVVAAAFGAVALLDMLTRDEEGFPKK